jgi:hypothetical protein
VSEGGSLASVLDHTMYAGMSLGRVGLDFRPLLAPIFEARIMAMFSEVGCGGVGGLCVPFYSAVLWSGSHCRSARTVLPPYFCTGLLGVSLPGSIIGG